MLEQLPEEVAVLVKQEVELHISALHTELRTQVNEVVGLVRQEFHSVLEEVGRPPSLPSVWPREADCWFKKPMPFKPPPPPPFGPPLASSQ